MAKLSQIAGKEIRKTIPFYFQDNEGKLLEDKIVIKNPTKEQMEELRTIYDNKENNGEEITDEDLFFIMLGMFTDLESDMDREKFFDTMKYFNSVIEAVKLELDGILYEIVISGYEKIEQLFNMPEDKRIKLLATNPELKEAYLDMAKRQEDADKKNEDELKKQKEKSKRKAELLAELKKMED